MNIPEEKVKETVNQIVRLLLELVSQCQEPVAPAAAPPAIQQWMTRQEYAVHRNVSPATVYRWLQAGLPSFKEGGVSRIEVQPADSWLAAGGLSKRKIRSKRA